MILNCLRHLNSSTLSTKKETRIEYRGIKTLRKYLRSSGYIHASVKPVEHKNKRPLSLHTQYHSSKPPLYPHKQSTHTHLRTDPTEMYTPTQTQVLSKSPISTISFPSLHFSFSTNTQTNSEVLPAVPLQMLPTDESPTRSRRKLESLCPHDLWSSRRSCRRMLE